MRSILFLKMILISAILFSVGFAQAQYNPFFPSKTVELNCSKLRDIQSAFLFSHILYNEFNATIEARVVDQYVEYLDPSKIYFSQMDVSKVKKELKNIYTYVKKRDCTPLKKVQKIYLDKVNARAAFAKKMLASKFKFNAKTKLTLDPDDRGYAKNEKELKQLQGKYLHFQISNHLVSDKKLPEAVKLVSRSYDRVLKRLKKLKDTDMYTNYLNAFAHSLDPHTSYFSKEVLEDFEISMKLELEGIGATLTLDDGFTRVETLIKGGAAERSGLMKSQDKIIEVGQVKNEKAQPMENVIEWDLRDVVRLIRGKKGTKVRLKILRMEKGKPTHQTITLVRDKIKLEDEAAQLSYIEKDLNGKSRKIGVINLPSFYADSSVGGRSSARDVKKLINDAKKAKVDGIVLDLSMNGGGSLKDAVDLAGLFFKTGNVVKQSSRSKKAKATPLRDTDKTVDWAGPLVVLTSRFSASASEIVSGTLKDYDRAVVVGADHTFGKGSVQQVVPLAPGLGALKVTVGMFFTPGGFSTQHKGVESHIVFPSANAIEERGEKTLDFSLPPKKIARFVSRSAFGGWKVVAKTTIKKLNKRAQKRIKTSKKFKEIYEDIAEAKKRDKKTIILADSLKDRKKSKKEYDKKKKLSEKEKEKEYLERADINEAANIVVDLIDLTKGVPLKIAAKPGKVSSIDGKKRMVNEVTN